MPKKKVDHAEPKVAAKPLPEHVSEMGKEELDALLKQIDGISETEYWGEFKRSFFLANIARLDNEEGFAAFYELVHGKEMPKHAGEWIRGIYEARREGRGIVIEAFRGSTKTTTVTITFTAFRIGHEPQRANLLIQVGDDIAVDNAGQIADIIANNPGWKLAFPNIVPDKEKGWGAGGYEVKREDMEYEKWREQNAARKDPTLVGVGYMSSEIIGKHPDGVMVIDDIHDEGNTSSRRELDKVHRVLTGTIFPAMTPETWKVFIGTPWVEEDVLRYVASTGEYKHIKTPVVVEGEYVWPERFGEKEVESARRLAGSTQFARMFLLDLSARERQVLKYQSYPNSEIRYGWVMVGGCDYAGTMNVERNKGGKGDYFALAYIAKLPGGGAVVVDGVLERCTQGEAEGYVKRAQEIYGNWRYTVVEGDGKGEEFIQVLKRNPGLKIVPMKTGGKGKAARLERQMGPWLENGTIRVSDAETPFLAELRRELETYPLCEHDDALDAVYWGLRGMPEVLSMPRSEEELPVAIAKKKAANPYLSLGSAR